MIKAKKFSAISGREMFRIGLCLFIISTTLYNPVRAQYGVAATGFLGPPFQLELASRRVLTSAAHKLKQEWQQEGMPKFPNVLARFVGAKKSWIVRCEPSESTVASRYAADKMVRNALLEKLPSATKPFSVLFIFDSHPSNARSPALVPDESGVIDFGPYMNRLERKVRRNWSFPHTSVTQRGRSVVSFVLTMSGAVTKLKLKSSSGNSEYDEAALRAISLSGPFWPLPASPSDKILIELTFDYYIPRATTAYSIHLAEPDIIDSY